MTTSRNARASEGVTIGIPVYNEERILCANAGRLVAHLERLDVPFEVLIGSNGSTDTTVHLARQLHEADRRIEGFHVPERGVGVAFREFVRRARYPVLISLDMDLSADLVFVDRALALAATHDIVVGSKRLAPQRRSVLRKAGSDFFLWCTRLLTGLPYDDYSIGAKAYRVEFLRSVDIPIDDGSSYVLDLCFQAHRRGLRVARVPVACEDRRVSKFNLPREAVYKFSRLYGLWARSVVRPAPRSSAAPVDVSMLMEKPR